MFWASRTGADAKLVAFTRLEQGASRNLPLVVRCDDSHGSTFYTFEGESAERLLQKIATPHSNEFAHLDGFEEIAHLLKSTNASISVFQQVRFMGMDLGSWHDEHTTGVPSVRGATTYGERRTFVIYKKQNALGFNDLEITRGPYEEVRDHTILLQPTLPRIGWDLVHIMAVTAVSCGLYAVLNPGNRKESVSRQPHDFPPLPR